MGVVYYCENVHLLRHRSEHTSASKIYYQMESLTKALQCKAKYAVNMKPDPTLSDAEDFYPTVQFAQNHGHWYVYQKICHFHWNILNIELSTEPIFECSFSKGSYYLPSCLFISIAQPQ